MYESFYGLKEKPFDLHPDPDYLYMSRGHENVYTHLEYAIAENKGFVIVTGEIGSGKTTLINFLLTKIRQDIEVGLISNTSLTPEQFIMMICEEFEVSMDGSGQDKAKMLGLFHGFLLEQFAEKKRVILIIDEAQNLTLEALEEVRMLSNLEAEKHHLIQIILVGQPELKYKLQLKDLEQFAQRVTVHCHLDGLRREDVDQYIRYRLKVAGAINFDIFREDAIEAVHMYSRGIPRLINILCDTALVFGYADSLKTIDKGVIEAVVKARKAGGLFTERKKRPKTSSPAPAETVTPLSEPPKAALRAMEKRVHLLEMMVVGLKMRMDLLTEKRSSRDNLVLELFKMLKESMESRMKMVMKYLELGKTFEAARSEPKDSREAISRRRFFGLSPRRVIWLIIALVAIGAALTLVDMFVMPLDKG